MWFNVLRDIAAVLGVLAGIAVSLGILNSKVVSPLIAKPLARELRHQLSEEVIIIVRSEEVTNIIQEEVASEMGVILDALQTVDSRLTDEVIPRLERVEKAAGIVVKQTSRSSGRTRGNGG